MAILQPVQRVQGENAQERNGPSFDKAKTEF
jgi:hypothetical protein